MNLRAKVALSLAAIVLLIMTIAGVGAGVGAADAVEDTVDRGLKRQVDEIRNRDPNAVRDVEEAGPGANDRKRCEPSPGRSRDRNDAMSRFVTAEGRLYACEFDKVDLTPAEVAVFGDPTAEVLRSVEINGRPHRMITASFVIELGPGLRVPAALQIARPLEDFGLVRDAVLRQAALWGLIGALVAGAVGWALVRRLSQPIESLTIASERVAETQDLTERIDVGSNDEVGRMGQSFNTMLDALQTSQQQQHRLVQDANHELRTPLTSLRTNIEVLQRAPNLPDHERESLLADIGSELNELTSLVEELVASATDVTSSAEVSEPVDLGELANDVVERFRRRTGRIITLEQSAPAEVTVRASMVERALTNLVNNAIKFSPGSFPIDVVVDGRRFEVRDRGPGIAEAELDKVFDRFYRSTDARSQPGSGLGLSIVRQVALNHGGSVWAANRPDGGARVGFEIGDPAQRP